MTRELVEFVVEQTTRPLDRWAVAATLESGGIRDVDARERYGKRDVFELADEVHRLCLEQDAPERDPGPASPARPAALARRYLRGAFFFVQLALQLGSLAFLGYGQWASLEFTGRQASVVGLALLASFLLTGPASQGIGYLGSFFAEPGKHLLASRAVAGAVVAGLVSLLAGALLASIADLAFGWYDARTLGMALVYFALAGCTSLTSAVLYMQRQFLGMVIATVCGIATVGVILHRTSWGIYAAHWTGLAVSIAIESAWAAEVLRRRRAETAPELRLAVRPPLPVLGLLVLPYALYGLAYFGLLFSDRLAAWSAGARGLPFTFRAPYEAGLDWALIGVSPALAFLEVTIYLFARRLDSISNRYGIGDAHAYNRAVLRFRNRQIGYVCLLLVSGASASTGLLFLLAHTHATKVSSLFDHHITLWVYTVGLCGYALLVLGLFNCVFLFSLGRPWDVLRALIPGVVVAIVVSLVLSRVVVYWAAAGGLVAGTLVFATLAAAVTGRILRSTDYRYFAAY